MAIVLLIVTLLLGGLLMPLSMQVEQRKVGETQKTLEEIKEALIGFAIARGRLPCPAIAASNGVEDPNTPGGGVCTSAHGFVPAVTLGITPTDDQGFAIDGWGQRIRYAVTIANGNAITTVDGLRTVGLAAFSPDLHVCASGTGVGTSDCGAAGNNIATSVPALIYSLGPNWAAGGAGTDEAENLDPDKVFVSHPPSAAAGNEFDDLVTWLSPYLLFNRMIAAGRLP